MEGYLIIVIERMGILDSNREGYLIIEENGDTGF